VRKVFERCQGAGTIPLRVEQLDQSVQARFIKRVQLHGLPCPARSFRIIAVPAGSFGHRPGQIGSQPPKPHSLHIQPVLEFRGVIHVESRKKVSPVDLHGLERKPIAGKRLEPGSV